jgi:two-component system, OmpR family, sensor kinase
MIRMRWFKERLHRVLFVWFAGTVLVTGCVSFAVVMATTPDRGAWMEWRARLESYVGHRLEEAWDDPVARTRLVEDAARDFEVSVVLENDHEVELTRVGACNHEMMSIPVHRGRAELGRVRICRDDAPWGGPIPLVLGLLSAVGVLWFASGIISHALTRPLRKVAAVAQDLGEGKLESRVKLGRERGEVRVLGDAINEMARRIEKQVRDQRELLATVSHEIRTPLGHIRLLLDIGRERGVDAKSLDELEKEVLEIDGLVDQLLASSRVDFDNLDIHRLDAREVALRALERKNLPESLLEVDTDDTSFPGDPTLIARAIANLLDNAQKHANGCTTLRVREESATELVFEVEDDGPGFENVDKDRVFDAFFRGQSRAGSNEGSLGLGLALVRRIARAHGGYCFASDRAKGATVGFTVRRHSI